MCFFAQTSPGPSIRKRNRASSADIDESIDLTNVSSVLGLHTIFKAAVLLIFLFKGEPTAEESQGYRGRHN